MPRFADTDLTSPDPAMEAPVSIRDDAPMVSRWAKFAGLGEQVVISGMSFLMTLLAGRILPRPEFAALGLAIALYYAVTGVHRNLVIIQFTLDSARRGDARRRPRVWDRLAFGLAALLAAAALTTGLTLAALRLVEPWIASGVIGGGLLLFTASLHDYSRYRCTTAGRGVVIALSGVTFAVALPLLVALVTLGLHAQGGVAFALALALAYGAALLPMWIATRDLGVETGESVLSLLRREWPNAQLNLYGHGAYIAYTQLIVFLVAGALGATAAAAFIATRSLMNPVATVVTGLSNTQSVDIAYAEARGGAGAVARLILRQIALIAVICAPYILATAIFAEPLLKLAFGNRYVGDGHLLAWWSLAFAALVCSQPLEGTLLALRLNRRLLLGRLAAAAIGVAFAWFGAKRFGVSGAVIGMGLGLTVAALSAADGLLRARNRAASV